jgi:hypothetical protein
MQILTVGELPVEDCWRDMARIRKKYRKTEDGRSVDRNTICKVTVGGKSKLLALRGCREKEPKLLLDSSTRHELDLEVEKSYEVEIHRAGWFGYWRWAWGAADPAYRLTAQISLISLGLGVIGLFLGLLPLLLPHH